MFPCTYTINTYGVVEKIFPVPVKHNWVEDEHNKCDSRALLPKKVPYDRIKAMLS